MRHRRFRKNQMQTRKAWTASGALLFSIVSGLVTFLAARRRRQKQQTMWGRIKAAAT